MHAKGPRNKDERTIANVYSYLPPGTPLFGGKIKDDGSAEETRVVRAGIFDDVQVLNAQRPQVEIYTERRVEWVSAVKGAKQFGGGFGG